MLRFFSKFWNKCDHDFLTIQEYDIEVDGKNIHKIVTRCSKCGEIKVYEY